MDAHMNPDCTCGHPRREHDEAGGCCLRNECPCLEWAPDPFDLGPEPVWGGRA